MLKVDMRIEAGNQKSPIRARGDRADSLSVEKVGAFLRRERAERPFQGKSPQSIQRHAQRAVEYPGGSVVAGREDACAVGAEANVKDHAAVVGERRDELSRLREPDLDRVVGAAGHQEASIGTETGAFHCIRMTAKLPHELAGVNIPRPCNRIPLPASCHQLCAVRAELQGHGPA